MRALDARISKLEQQNPGMVEALFLGLYNTSPLGWEFISGNGATVSVMRRPGEADEALRLRADAERMADRGSPPLLLMIMPYTV